MADVALVTGAGRGIGRAIAVRLAEEGYAVGITARSVDQLEETADLVRRAGGRVAIAPGDVTDFGDVTKVCRAISDALGPVDVLVNNAGYAGLPEPFAEIDPDDWWRVVETNVRGPVNFSRALLPDMVRRKRGYVVNVNSMQGSKVLGASIAYGASKAALMRFTDALATEIADSAVVVVDLSPSLVRTTMTANRPDLIHHRAGASACRGCAEKGDLQAEPPGGITTEPDDHALGRSRGGWTTKLHLGCEQGQKPLSIVLTAGQRGDSPQFVAVPAGIRVPRLAGGRPRTRPDRVLADKAYTCKANREHLRRRGIRATIPSKIDQDAHRKAKGRRVTVHQPSTPRTTSSATRWNVASTGSNVSGRWPLATTSSPCATKPPSISPRSTNGSDRLGYRP